MWDYLLTFTSKSLVRTGLSLEYGQKDGIAGAKRLGFEFCSNPLFDWRITHPPKYIHLFVSHSLNKYVVSLVLGIHHEIEELFSSVNQLAVCNSE